MLALAAFQPAHAQSARAGGPFYQYELTWPQPHTRTYQVALTVPKQSGSHTQLSIAAWRPGRYTLQHYAAAVTGFQALDDAGAPLAWHKSNKDTWAVANPPRGSITVRYSYYANTIHNGASLLTDAFAYFNPVNLFMYVPGQLNQPAQLTMPGVKPDWSVVTQLQPTANKQVWLAPTWHDLADAPTVAAPVVRQLSFDVAGTQCVASFIGTSVTPNVPTDAASQHYQTHVTNIVRAHQELFGEIPTPRFDFIYLIGPFGTGATEHSASAMFVYSTDILANDRAIGSTFSTTSHEFFHLYNVKRIRPASMWPYDYSQASPTQLLWWFEGVTDYYADILLTRAGTQTPEFFLQDYARELTALENDPTQRSTSPSVASASNWLDDSQFKDPSRVRSFMVSIYTLGKRVGLLMDLEIRRRTKGQKSLDDVCRYLYTEYWKKNRGVPDDGVLKAVEAVTGSDFKAWYTQYIDTPAPVDYASVLEPMGLRAVITPNQQGVGLQAIGIDRLQPGQSGLSIAAVRPGSEASEAGIGPGMLLLGVNGGSAIVNPDIANDWKPGQTITLRVADIIGNTTPRDITVTFSGKHLPVRVTLDEITGQTDWIRTSWLKPVK